jgi:hypothetical protein
VVEKSFLCRFNRFGLILLVEVLVQTLESSGSRLSFYLFKILIFFLFAEELPLLFVFSRLALI